MHISTTHRRSVDRFEDGEPTDGGTMLHRPSCVARTVSLLLCPFRRAINFFIFDSFKPKDTFPEKVRKVTSGAMALASISFVANLMDFGTTVSNPSSTSDQLLYAYLELVIYDLFPVFSMCLCFAYTRRTKTVPDWAIGIPCLCLLTATLFYSLATATMDLVGSIIVMYAVADVSSLGRVWSYAALGISVLVLIVNGLNITRTHLLLIPGARGPFEPQSLINYLSAQVLEFAVMSLFLYAVVRESDRMIVKAQGAESISTQLASCLQRYDTSAARELLKRCQTTESMEARHGLAAAAGGVTSGTAPIIDAALLYAFHGIVENLERYRPHLPNYLVETTNTSSTSTFEGGPMLLDDLQMNEIDMAESDTTGDNPFLLTTTSLREHRASFSVVVPTESGNFFMAPTAAATTVPEADEATRARPRPSVTPNPGKAKETSFHGLVETKVATTIAEIILTDGCPDRKKGFDAVVGAIYSAAASTHGSVHGFLGDRVVTTWNATKKVSKPETRACIFAVRLQAILSRDGFGAMASMTATAIAESCFAGDQRLQLFKCTSKRLWDVATAGLDRIRHLRVAAMDDATREQASVDVRSRGLALLKKDAERPASVCIYELIAEKDDADNDMEWMYRLERNVNDPDELISDALKLYAASHVEEAIVTLRRALSMSSSAPSQAMQELLKDMLQSDELKGSMRKAPVPRKGVHGAAAVARCDATTLESDALPTTSGRDDMGQPLLRSVSR